MKSLVLTFLICILSLKGNAQPCGIAQALSTQQQAQISALLSPLDTALVHENLIQIDSLSQVLKTIYGNQGGIPEDVETYYTLVSNTNWLEMNPAILLSQQLISADSLVYVNLWKVAKGMNPPLYQAHSIFLRAAAENAVGLLKIAAYETDATRKALYQSWAISALDSLATMQIQSGASAGAFPFPDLRTYGDPVFTPIIQNFLNACGPDSVNVLQDGWIINDKGTGEFKFDAGLIANAYFEAFQYTGNVAYKNIALAIGNYLKPLKFNHNYNYNSFVALGLSRAFQLSNDSTFLNRAIQNLRYAVYPGQIPNGRWVDGHNANSRYHSIMIQNMVPTVQLMPGSHLYKTVLDSMCYKAVKNMVDYSFICHSATGYRWLMQAFTLDASIIPLSLKDSIIQLIGQHINQSASNGKYLDVPTLGVYFELLDFLAQNNEVSDGAGELLHLFPNPSTGNTKLQLNLTANELVHLMLSDLTGRQLCLIDQGPKQKGKYEYAIDLSKYPAGIYLLGLKTNQRQQTKKILKID